MPAHLPARTRLVRREEGLRPGRLRGLHGPRRRAAGAQLSLPGRPRRGPQRHHRGGPRLLRRRAPPGAAAVPGRPGLPVRLLHRRLPDDHRRAPGRGGHRPRRRQAPGPPARLQGQHLPLYGLPRHRGRGARGQAHRGPGGRAGRGQVPGRPRRPPRRHRHRPLHLRRRGARAAAHEAAALPAPARPHRRHRHQGRPPGPRRPRGPHPPRLPRPAVFVRPARAPDRGPDGHPRPGRRGPLRRPARGGRRRRQRAGRRGGLPPGGRHVRGAPVRHRPGGGHAAGCPRPPPQGSRIGDLPRREQRVRRGPQHARRHGEGVRGGGRRLRGDLPDPARAARQFGDPRQRRVLRTQGGGRRRAHHRPLLHPGTVPDPAGAVRPLRPR